MNAAAGSTPAAPPKRVRYISEWCISDSSNEPIYDSKDHYSAAVAFEYARLAAKRHGIEWARVRQEEHARDRLGWEIVREWVLVGYTLGWRETHVSTASAAIRLLHEIQDGGFLGDMGASGPAIHARIRALTSLINLHGRTWDPTLPEHELVQLTEAQISILKKKNLGK